MAKSNAKETAHVKSRNREILGILVLVISVIVFLSLVTHSENDWPGSSREFGEPADNLIGWLGAFLSHIIFEYIGYSGYFAVAFMMISGAFVFMHRPLVQLVKPLVLITILGISLPLLASLVFQIGSDTTLPAAESSYGGIMGIMMTLFMVTYLGRTGAILISLAVVLVVLVLGTNLKPSTIVDYIVAAAREVYDRISDSARKHAEQKKKTASTKSRKRRSSAESAPDEAEAVEEETPFITPVDEEPAETIRPRREPEILMNGHERSTASFTPPAVDSGEMPEEGDEEFDDSLPDSMDIDITEDTESDEMSELVQYELPTVEILDEPRNDQPSETREELLEKAEHLVESLMNFNIEAEVTQITPGPIVTRYELALAPGIKVGRVVNLSDDLQLALKAKGGIRILAPIPGKAAIGIEVPNKLRSLVYFRDIVEAETFRDSDLPLVLALGKNTAGEPVVADLARMPHLLIAGSTGSGKSVCINTLIASVLMKATPDQVRMLMIDPKVVELALYKKVPHLLAPVVSDPKQASNVLKWAVSEMESRYRLLASRGVRDIKQYNEKIRALAEETIDGGAEKHKPETIPYIMVIIDEFADLMVVASNEVEEYIARLAQMARAVGIHLVLATQRPSSDVITGLIKANFPSRIAFKVMQASNSRIILDYAGADKLLGMGDMLFLQVGKPEPIRLHGAYISNDECTRIADFVSGQQVKNLESIPEDTFMEDDGDMENSLGLRDPSARDALFFKAARLVVRNNQGSVSLLQRRLKIGYARAARLIDQLELASVVGPYDGSKAREVLVDDLYIDELEAGEI